MPRATAINGKTPLTMLDRVVVEERETAVDAGDRYDQALPIDTTPNQRLVISPAIERCRQIWRAMGSNPNEPDITEGRAIELICADFIAAYGVRRP